MKIFLWLCVLSVIISSAAFAAEKVLFDFENDGDRWAVPEWCWDKSDYVCKTAVPSADFSRAGTKSLKLDVDLPGTAWRATVAECGQCSFDWSQYSYVAADFYLPKGASGGLGAKLILTVEDNGEWKWTEGLETVSLVPGEWVTVKMGLKPGSKNWMRFQGAVETGKENDPRVTGALPLDVTDAFRKNVRKVSIRVESDTSAYKGPVYIDNIRVIE